MMDTVTKIMVEVLNIIGVATNEIKRGQISTFYKYKQVHVDRTIFREIYEEAIQSYDGY